MRSLALACALALAACGGSPTTTSGPVPATAAKASPPVEASPAPGNTLARSAVHAAVADGLPLILQRVELDDHPVMAGGKFHGFRIVALRDPAFWAGVDLKPGDVVTSVNGFPIEHPEEAQTALESLDVASELKVAYERDGQTRELVYAIVDGR